MLNKLRAALIIASISSPMIAVAGDAPAKAPATDAAKKDEKPAADTAKDAPKKDVKAAPKKPAAPKKDAAPATK